MSPNAALSRLRAMDPEELRFRVGCEARKLAGRVRYALRPPSFDRRRFVDILDSDAGPRVGDAVRAAKRGDYLSAHRSLAAHVAERRSSWPIQASRRRAFVAELRDACPDALTRAVRRADRLVEGRHDFLGYRDVPLTDPPDWHADPIHGRRAPFAFWTRVPYLDPAIGDHKVIWEINRHQYWLPLGAAYWLSGDRRYRDLFVSHAGDWIAHNPPLHGVNWASMLELAFRALSWTWAVEFFAADTAQDETPWLVDLFVSLDAQLAHVAANLSLYFSPNTHLTGEALALYAVSMAFPELRASRGRAATGRRILVREIARQIRADGGHAELSAHYHRYTTDFYLLALMVARASGDPASAAFEEVGRRLAAYLRTIADDGGALPLLGDDDGGQLFAFGGHGSADASPTLGAAASLLRDPSLAVRAPDEDVYWILGRRPEPFEGRTMWPSRTLEHCGYFVPRGPDGDQLIFDVGPHGFLNGGHAHADALSVIVNAGGEPLLVDPGTATYVMDAAARDRMRAPRMHNTVTLHGRDHAAPRGPFHWHSRADARLLTARLGPRIDFAVGTHDSHAPASHVRAVLAVPGAGWLIVDRITGHDTIAADAWWHFHPAWQAVVRDGLVALRSRSGRRLALATTADRVEFADPDLSVYAPEYGRVERAATIRTSRTAAAPFVIGTFIPSVSHAVDSLTVVELPGSASGSWTMCRFAVVTRDGERRFEVPFNLDPAPSASDWPEPAIDDLLPASVQIRERR